MKQKLTKLLFITLLAMLSLVACSPDKATTPQGIIVTSPEVSEIIAAIGGIDQIIARTSYCDYPEELQNIESVGDFSSVDIERIISLNPKLIFVASFEQKSITDKLKPFGIEVVTIHSNSIESFYQNIQLIGDKLGLSQNATEVINSFQSEITNLTIPKKRPSIYFEISPNLGTVTDASFIGDMIIKAGGNNIFNHTDRDFLIAKNEDIVTSNPDIIIALSGVSQKEITDRMGWSELNAVQNNLIFTNKDLESDHFMRTIPRSIIAIKAINKIVNSDEFTKQ